jgi:hypothetical protein
MTKTVIGNCYIYNWSFHGFKRKRLKSISSTSPNGRAIGKPLGTSQLKGWMRRQANQAEMEQSEMTLLRDAKATVSPTFTHTAG